MADNETIADIIAEMRILKCRNMQTGELESCNAIANYFADRLDAANRRERGDCAKLREVLRAIWEEANTQYQNDNGIDPEWLIAEAYLALSAPPRNCDVYDSYGDAIRAFEDDENAEGYEDMAEWLFAPATEKEGGNDENE